MHRCPLTGRLELQFMGQCRACSVYLVADVDKIVAEGPAPREAAEWPDHMQFGLIGASRS